MNLDAIKLRVTVEALLGMGSEAFEGLVFRATAAGANPLEGSSDGRWGAGPSTAVVYTSLDAANAVAELVARLRSEDAISASRKHMLHEMAVFASRVIRLTIPGRLVRLGVPAEFLATDDYRPTQRVAEAAHRLGIAGLIVPSAVGAAANLVLFPDHLESTALTVLSTSRLSPIEIRTR